MTSRIGTIAVFALLILTVAVGGSPPAQAQDVKIGIVQPLSGIPVIVDFGESYLQGNKLAVKVVDEIMTTLQGLNRQGVTLRRDPRVIEGYLGG